MACTPGRVKAVFKLRKEGKTWKAIGELFECCIQLVFHIRVDLGIIKSPEKPFTQIAYWVAQSTHSKCPLNSGPESNLATAVQGSNFGLHQFLYTSLFIDYLDFPFSDCPDSRYPEIYVKTSTALKKDYSTVYSRVITLASLS